MSNRNEKITFLKTQSQEWDVIIIGGGATGLGCAVDAAARGFKTLLLEQHDFAKGTSSRSTKLIHGGLRYLQQGNIKLVREALKERGLLCENAPHLVHPLPFVVPHYHWWETPFYGVGLKLYDMLAGKEGLEPSLHLNRKQTLHKIPTLQRKGLRGGALYYDGQFDDARLALTLALTASDHGATVLNYMHVTSLLKKGKKICGVKAIDLETHHTFSLKAKVVINATGVFADKLRLLDNKKEPPLLAPSQGIHVVLPLSFMPTQTALLIPHTDDGRVIFLVPWHGKLLLGTTDTETSRIILEPRPLKKEIQFLLKHAAHYLNKTPQEKDILSVFAGLRPLVHAKHAKKSAQLSRDHTLLISPSGLVTITGGKWTTYRKMAQDTLDQAIVVGRLPKRKCITHSLPLHGFLAGVDPQNHLSLYGSDIKLIKALLRSSPSLRKKIHPRLPYSVAEIVFSIRHEMARTVEDVLARRTRALFLDAHASLQAAPLVAKILAKELNKFADWEKRQIRQYEKIARAYLPHLSIPRHPPLPYRF